MGSRRKAPIIRKVALAQSCAKEDQRSYARHDVIDKITAKETNTNYSHTRKVAASLPVSGPCNCGYPFVQLHTSANSTFAEPGARDVNVLCSGLRAILGAVVFSKLSSREGQHMHVTPSVWNKALRAPHAAFRRGSCALDDRGAVHTRSSRMSEPVWANPTCRPGPGRCITTIRDMFSCSKSRICNSREIHSAIAPVATSSRTEESERRSVLQTLKVLAPRKLVRHPWTASTQSCGLQSAASFAKLGPPSMACPITTRGLRPGCDL
ncbi:hypothetical protein OH76DRAFT_41971 [Lentinus brumalis]|uniref:Uncharacterized protein n=1 Tax=Lentinus brumalis TaxID=2498619 RepID=A0A371DY48_9APHY|nr:hypothetical protein OH76DRAFT_41971 [Polyporus brumalis]